jgi:hypothetical protein
MEITMDTSYYLDITDQRLGAADNQDKPEIELAHIARAQVMAIQAVAAALDRLAGAVEPAQLTRLLLGSR